VFCGMLASWSDAEQPARNSAPSISTCSRLIDSYLHVRVTPGHTK
jgi:hypothetical protein